MSLLKDDFKKRNEWLNYRSSAVFPAIIDNENFSPGYIPKSRIIGLLKK